MDLQTVEHRLLEGRSRSNSDHINKAVWEKFGIQDDICLCLVWNHVKILFCVLLKTNLSVTFLKIIQNQILLQP